MLKKIIFCIYCSIEVRFGCKCEDKYLTHCDQKSDRCHGVLALSAREESIQPIFVASEQRLDVSVKANIQPAATKVTNIGCMLSSRASILSEGGRASTSPGGEYRLRLLDKLQ